MSKIKLTRPIEVMGQPVNELEMDLDSVTGADLMDALYHAEKGHGAPGGTAYNVATAAFLAARACKVNVPTILELAARDFSTVCAEVGPLLEGSD